jgi:hypothetical protein
MATQIDPRGPRFGDAITNVFSIVLLWLGLDTSAAAQQFALIILSIVTALFLIGAIFGNNRHPYGLIFKKLVRPRLKAPKELEDSRPPQFAQFVGLVVAGAGLALYFAQVPYGIAIAAGALLIATTLQAYFGYCLGCQIYLGLKRLAK